MGHYIPRSVILINWILSLLAIGGLRVVARWLLTREGGLKSSAQFNGGCKKVLVYGAGDAGIQLVSALSHSSEYNPVGFIDDSNELQGNQIRGLNIYSVNSVERVINKLKVDEVLIAMPSASRTKRLDIINTLEPYPVLVRMLPGVAELAEGKVSIKDLLGRESVVANKDLLGRNITNKVAVVTGAGGSIGSELCRQIVFLKPKVFLGKIRVNF